MAITFPAYNRNSDLVSSSFAVTKPAGLIDTDYLLFLVATGGDSGNNSSSGFTEVEDWQNSSGDNKTLGVFYKKITDAAGEPATYTVAFGQTEEAVADLLIVRGADLTSFADVAYVRGTHGVDTQNTNSPQAAPVTTNTDGAVAVIFGVVSQGATEHLVSQPAGYTGLGGPASINQGWDRAGTGAGDARFVCGYKTVATAGAETPAAWTGLVNTRDWLMATIAIRPASGVITPGVFIDFPADTITYIGGTGTGT